jgi:methionine synthase II (cobalamin-independent)
MSDEQQKDVNNMMKIIRERAAGVDFKDDKKYTCDDCGFAFWSARDPESIKWVDGHICYFGKGESLGALLES